MSGLFQCGYQPGLPARTLVSAVQKLRQVTEASRRPFPVRAAVSSLPRACSPRKKKSIAPHSVPHSPHPPRFAKGASLFVPDSSRAFLSCPRTMHDEIRTGPPYGHALSIPHYRKAQQRVWAFVGKKLDEAAALSARAAARTIVVVRIFSLAFSSPGRSTARLGRLWTVRMEGS